MNMPCTRITSETSDHVFTSLPEARNPKYANAMLRSHSSWVIKGFSSVMMFPFEQTLGFPAHAENQIEVHRDTRHRMGKLLNVLLYASLRCLLPYRLSS